MVCGHYKKVKNWRVKWLVPLRCCPSLVSTSAETGGSIQIFPLADIIHMRMCIPYTRIIFLNIQKPLPFIYIKKTTSVWKELWVWNWETCIWFMALQAFPSICWLTLYKSCYLWASVSWCPRAWQWAEEMKRETLVCSCLSPPSAGEVCLQLINNMKFHVKIFGGKKRKVYS